MRHSLYVNNQRVPYEVNRRTMYRREYGESPRGTATKNGGKTKVDMILEAKINAVLKKHDGNNEILAEIQDKVNMYCINVSIAREYEDITSIRKLRRDLIDYLNSKN